MLNFAFATGPTLSRTLQYGLEKLASEEVYKHYQQDFGIQTRIARFHNIYGPFGTWKGGREKVRVGTFFTHVIFCRGSHCDFEVHPGMGRVFPNGWISRQSAAGQESGITLLGQAVEHQNLKPIT